MNVRSQEVFTTAETAPDQQHPGWCDPSRCTANPASQTDGYRSGVGGEHRSADLPVDVPIRLWPVPDSIVAFLSEAVAPWRCSTYVRILADGNEVVAMPVESAAPVLAALLGLVTAAEADWEASLR